MSVINKSVRKIYHKTKQNKTKQNKIKLKIIKTEKKYNKNNSKTENTQNSSQPYPKHSPSADRTVLALAMSNCSPSTGSMWADCVRHVLHRTVFTTDPRNKSVK